MADSTLTGSISDLKKLESVFKGNLDFYENIRSEYVNTLNSSSLPSTTLKIYPNTLYMAPPSISSSKVDSADACLALCSANTSCKSAFYNHISNNCELQSGDPLFVVNQPDISSIVIPPIVKSSSELTAMNNYLKRLETAINLKVKEQKDLINQHYSENATTNENMITEFQNLQAQRDNIGKIIDEFEFIKENNNDQRLRISQGISKYVFWGIISLVAMFITVKMIFFPDSDTNIIRLFFNACIVILLILWTMNLSSVVITFIILFLIAMILISKFT